MLTVTRALLRGVNLDGVFQGPVNGHFPTELAHTRSDVARDLTGEGIPRLLQSAALIR
jgi:hypothetical protein